MKLVYTYKNKRFEFPVKETPQELKLCGFGICGVTKTSYNKLNLYSMKGKISMEYKNINRRQKKIILKESLDSFNKYATFQGLIFVDDSFRALNKDEQLAILLHEGGHAFGDTLDEEYCDNCAIAVVGEPILVSALEKLYLFAAGGDIEIAKLILKNNIETGYSHREKFHWNLLK